MAAPISKKASRAKAPVAPAPATAIPDGLPPDMPETYGMQISGDCMAPDFPNGEIAVVSRTEAPQPGDTVCLWFRPEFVKPGGNRAIIKQMVLAPPPWVKSFPHNEHPESEVAAVVIVKQINPEQHFSIRCDRLLAIHKVTGLQNKKED